MTDHLDRQLDGLLAEAFGRPADPHSGRSGDQLDTTLAEAFGRPRQPDSRPATTHRGVDPDQLTGEAARMFSELRETYRAFGSPDEQATARAVDDVIESGTLPRGSFDRTVDALCQFGSGFGATSPRWDRWDDEARRLAVDRYKTADLAEARRLADARPATQPGGEGQWDSGLTLTEMQQRAAEREAARPRTTPAPPSGDMDEAIRARMRQGKTFEVALSEVQAANPRGDL